MAWLPVIDISQHQGAINFRTMRDKGVKLVIMRVSHGTTKDSRVDRYYDDALLAGYRPNEIGFYSFINPKRGSGPDTAIATAKIIFDVTGRTDVLYMLDIESYRNEGPNAGTSPVSGVAFSAYLRDHMRAFQAKMPGCRIIAYSNRAYWNSADGPRDSVLASELEWIVPRYPLYSDQAYLLKGFPPEPHRWDEYAFGLTTGPNPPIGADWHGWQFSAGFNKQGRVYGCESPDLDLNFVDAERAARWFALSAPPTPVPVPPIQVKEPDVLIPHDGVRLAGGQITLKANTPTKIAVAAGTPVDATGVAINLTFNGAMAGGYVTCWSGEGQAPGISQINYKAAAAGDPRNGFTITRIVDGHFTVQALTEVAMIFDQVGYTQPPIAGPQGVQGPQGPQGVAGPAGSGGTMTDEQIAAAVVRELSD